MMSSEEPTATGQGRYVLFAIVSGLVLVVALLILAYAVKNPTELQEWVFRVVMSLAAAGLGSALPGFIKLEGKIAPNQTVQAGGAIALFLVVFFSFPEITEKVLPARLAPPQLTLEVGQTKTITARSFPGGKITWRSGNPGAVSVTPSGQDSQRATVTGVARGRSRITATSGSTTAGTMVKVGNP